MLSYSEGRLAKGALDTLYMAEQNKLEDLREQAHQDGEIRDHFDKVRVQMSLDELYKGVLEVKDTPREALEYYFTGNPWILRDSEPGVDPGKRELWRVLCWLSRRGLIRTYGDSYWLTHLGKKIGELVEAIQ